MKRKMRQMLTRKSLTGAALLVLAALVLAAGLEWLMLRTLPPIFTDMEVDFSADPTLPARSATYVHASGRTALVEEWNLRRFLAAFFLQLAVLTGLFPLGRGKKIAAWGREKARNLKRTIQDEKSRNWKLLGAFLCAFLAVFFLSRFWIRDLYQRDNWMTGILCGCAGTAAGCLVAFRRTLANKPENFFLLLTLIAGGLLAFVLPDATRVSLDDGYHFQHAMNYSTLGHVRFTGAEWDAMQEENEKNYELDRWEAFLSAQDAKYNEGAVYVTSGFHLSVKEYWLAAHGLGLFLGRVLHLRFWDIWSLGRLTGLLAYALIGYFAIRRLKSGKMILAASLMIPSNVFLAANYSYDPGVTAGITISCAYWIAQWQEREKKLAAGDVAVMVVGMLFACYAKAIYFPMLLMFLFLPRSKFRNRKHRAAYTAVILLTMAAVMLYILLPLGKSGGQGDTRAEGNVNTFGQIQFILSNPLLYAEYLLHFLRDYLDPNKAAGLLCAFGYQGGGGHTVPVLMTLAVITFTDARAENLLPDIKTRACSLVLLAGTMILMVTSMYVWFSAVGSSAFPGVQPRYLLPLVYPAMALMGSNRTRNQVSPALYNGAAFAMMTFTVMAGTMYNVVEYYH